MHEVGTFLAILREDKLSGTFDKAKDSSCFCPFSIRSFYHVLKYSITVISIKFLRRWPMPKQKSKRRPQFITGRKCVTSY
jgi:hypothetical protein